MDRLTLEVGGRRVSFQLEADTPKSLMESHGIPTDPTELLLTEALHAHREGRLWNKEPIAYSGDFLRGTYAKSNS